MRCIGGYAHDRWYDVDTRSGGLIVPEIREIQRTAEPVDPIAESPPMTLYTIEQLIWPGWRFPLRVLVAPDVKIEGHAQPYDSCWPNPLVAARCRCEEIDAFPPWVFGIYNNSASHLDHCPVHGRWTFPPITPLRVSLDARAAWRFEQQDAAMRAIEDGADPVDVLAEYGLEPTPERRHTPSTATEPGSNRAHTE